MRFSPVVAVALALGVSAAVAQPKAAGSLPVERYVLDNGLEVILQPDPTVTSVLVEVW
jgi:hypothetical protein